MVCQLTDMGAVDWTPVLCKSSVHLTAKPSIQPQYWFLYKQGTSIFKSSNKIYQVEAFPRNTQNHPQTAKPFSKDSEMEHQ